VTDRERVRTNSEKVRDRKRRELNTFKVSKRKGQREEERKTKIMTIDRRNKEKEIKKERIKINWKEGEK
jgi:hypothetical protein